MRTTDTHSLKEYLLRDLEKLSDADPDILADYIIALLKHERADMEEWCVGQLGDFLHEHTKPFVDRLFKYLRNTSVSERVQDRKSEMDSNREHRDDRDSRRTNSDRRRSRSPRPNRYASDHDASRRQPPKSKRNLDGFKSDTRLVVDRIPAEYCNEDAVTSFFSKFGKLYSVQLESDRAVIEFESRDAAQKAVTCPEVIFGNRFVRLFFDRQSNQPEPKPQLPRVTTYTAPNYQPPPRPTPVNPYQERVKQQVRLLELSKQKQELLEAYLEQQKMLLSKLENDPLLEESTKQEIMNGLRTVDEKIRAISIERPMSPDTSPVLSNPPMERISRKLDLRPTTVQIQPIPEKLSDGNIEVARILFSSFGSVKDVLFKEDHLLVSFSSRDEAEKVHFIGQFNTF